MKREDKIAVVAELKDKFQNNQNFYVMDASGMSVAEINNFRRICYSKGIDYKVYKNTLIKKALEDIEGDFANLEEALKGFSGIM